MVLYTFTPLEIHPEALLPQGTARRPPGRKALFSEAVGPLGALCCGVGGLLPGSRTLAPQRLWNKAWATSRGGARHNPCFVPATSGSAQPPSCPVSEAAGPGRPCSASQHPCGKAPGRVRTARPSLAGPQGFGLGSWRLTPSLGLTWPSTRKGSIRAAIRRHQLSPHLRGLPAASRGAQGSPSCPLRPQMGPDSCGPAVLLPDTAHHRCPPPTDMIPSTSLTEAEGNILWGLRAEAPCPSGAERQSPACPWPGPLAQSHPIKL